jgi:hypothetical protein
MFKTAPVNTLSNFCKVMYGQPFVKSLIVSKISQVQKSTGLQQPMKISKPWVLAAFGNSNDYTNVFPNPKTIRSEQSDLGIISKRFH